MTNKHLPSLLLLMTLFSSAYAQGTLPFESAQALFGRQRLVQYPNFSLIPTDKSQEELASISRLLQQKPEIMQRTFIVIQVFTCQQELKVKPYLGVVRAKRIIDYLSKEARMNRKKFLIQDRGANPLDPDCKAGSGVTLFLKPDWRVGED